MRYLLPAVLGGTEIEAEEMWGGCAGGRPEYLVKDSRITITMPEGTPMEAVAPPIPPEPPFGSFVATGPGGNLLPFYRRWDEGWGKVGAPPWVGTWADICAESQQRSGGRFPVLLVPDPLREAPDLPWEHQFSDGGPLKVATSSASNRAAYVEGGGHLTAQEARVMGLALLRAANAEAEETLPEWEREFLENQG